MDFDLTADQKLFRATTREFLEKEMPLTRVRELADSGIGFEPDWWKRGSELGWNSMIVDPQGVEIAAIGTMTDIAVAHLDIDAVARVRRVNPALALRRFRVVPR